MPTNIPADEESRFFSRTRRNADKELMRRLDAVCDAEKPFNELKQQFGISMRDVCTYTGASYRSLQNWNSGVRQPSKWVLRCVVEVAVTNARK